MKKIKFIPFLACSLISLTSCSFIEGFFNSKKEEETEKVVEDLQVYGNDKLINENDIVEIESYYDFYFSVSIKGGNSVIKRIEVEDETILLAHSKSIYPIKPGQCGVTVVAKPTWSEKEYARKFVIKSVWNDTLESIYVSNNESGIEVDENNNVSISGKVYAKFKNGVTRFISGDSGLTMEVDTVNSTSTYKKVKLSYTLDGKTVSVSYDVPNNKVNKINKTILKQGYNTYYENGYYSNRGHVNTEGDANLLAIPVWFTDSPSYFDETLKDRNGKTQKEQIIEDLNEALFGDPIRKNDYSLKTYYKDESFGKLNIKGKVSEWFESEYVSFNNYHSDLAAREGILKEAYDWYVSTHPEDSTQYDCVFLFYGSTRYGGKGNNYGAFTSRMTETYKGVSNYGMISSLSMYGFTHYDDDVKDLSDLSDHMSNDALNCGTIIHEFAHTMGAVDLYSNSSRSVGGSTYYPFGEYSMQSADQAGHDAYHMMAFNWANPYVIDENSGDEIEITINDLHSSGDAIIISPSWNNYDSPFDEYMLLELFDTQSVNTYKVSDRFTGVRVYHVDSRMFDLNTYSLTSDATTYSLIPFTNTVNNYSGPNSLDSVLYKYQNLDIVHQIRKNIVNSKKELIEYTTTDHAKPDNWFVEGDSFSIEKYAKQFYNEGSFDDEEVDFNWTFKIESIKTTETGASATIKIKNSK
ncbi:MAG: hypothetical protein MJZ37_06050 [Bacilli bacterium]|nr:hypothetical protein [Bacilli bacterium]